MVHNFLMLLVYFVCISCCCIYSFCSNCCTPLQKFVYISVGTRTRPQHNNIIFHFNTRVESSTRFIIHINSDFCLEFWWIITSVLQQIDDLLVLHTLSIFTFLYFLYFYSLYNYNNLSGRRVFWTLGIGLVKFICSLIFK